MHSNETVTYWLERLKAGDQAAPLRLWEAYGERLIGLSLRYLRDAPRRAADEEDVALSAFESLFAGVRRGQFPRLDDRHDLWQVLMLLARRKSADQRQHERRQKRGGGRVRGESVFGRQAQICDEIIGIEQVVDGEPTPEQAAELVDEFTRRISMLGEELRRVALMKLEGYTVREIADHFQCVPRTIERKLQLIRSTWSTSLDP